MEGLSLGQVHPTAIISERAKLGENVTIGANVIVYDNVVLEDGVIVAPNTSIGEPVAAYYTGEPYENPETVIGSGSLLRSGAMIYAGVTLGGGFSCGHRITIREYARFGASCQVGTLSDIQGDCEIGNYVRLSSNVHISRKTRIGDYVWIFPYTITTNDPHPPSNELIGSTIENYAVLATKVMVLPGVTIGAHALVGAMSLVRDDVPPEAVVVGVPAKPVRTIHEIKNASGDAVYPWPEHFDRGMPWEGLGYEQWRAEQRETS